MSVNHPYMKKRDKFDIEAIQIVEFRDGMKFIPNESPAVKIIDAVGYTTPFNILYKKTDMKWIEFLYYDFFQKIAWAIRLIRNTRKYCINFRCDEVVNVLKYDNSCRLKIISNDGDDPLNWIVNFYEFVEFVQERFSHPSWIIPDYALETAKTQREYVDRNKNEGKNTEELNKYSRLWLKAMDPEDEQYSRKLACALAFREAIDTDPSLLQKAASVKEIAEEWVKGEGYKFHLCELGGQVSKNAYEQIASVLNWQIKGGAPRTQGLK